MFGSRTSQNWHFNVRLRILRMSGVGTRQLNGGMSGRALKPYAQIFVAHQPLVSISDITPGDSCLQGPQFSEKNDLATGYGLHLSASLMYLSDSFGSVCFTVYGIFLNLFALCSRTSFARLFFHLMCIFWHFVCILDKKDERSLFCLSAWLHIFCILFLFVIFFVSSFCPPGWQPYLLRAKFSKESVSQVTMRLILHTR